MPNAEHQSKNFTNALCDNGTLAYSLINRKVYYKPENVESILHVVAGRDMGKMCNHQTER